MQDIANKQYLAVKPQASATGVVIPTVFLPFISESIRVNPNFAADRRIKGNSWVGDKLVRGVRAIEGDIVVYGDVESLGHLFNMTYAKGSTSGNGTDGYTHPFTPGDGKYYTIEFSRGGYAQRVWGVRGDNLRLEFTDNRLQATGTIKALGQFYAASVGIALSGASTSVVLSTDSGPRPSDGLVVGDSISINGTTVVLTAVNADGKTVSFTSTSITAAVGTQVFLLAQTPSYTAPSLDPLYLDGTLVGVGVDTTAADTAAGARATATPAYQIVTNFKNNLLNAQASGFSGPAALLNQQRDADLQLRTLYSDPTLFSKWMESVKQAVSIVMTGAFIKSDQTTSELLTIKYHHVESTNTEEPLELDSYIFDTQNFQVLYDTTDAKAVEISLVNRTAGTVY